jgi:hypothetical protein
MEEQGSKDSNLLANTGATDAELLAAVAVLKGGTDYDKPNNLTDVHTYVKEEIYKLNINEDAEMLMKDGMSQEDAIKKATISAAKKRSAVDQAMKSYLASK